MDNILISGKQTKLGKALTEYVSNNLHSSLTKYFKSFVSANVLFSKSNNNFNCEVNIHVEKTTYVQSQGTSNDAYGSFNIANEKIKKRIRRYHKKLNDHRIRSKKSIKNNAYQYIIKNPESSKNKEEIDNPLIIAETEFLIKTLSVSEALMLMELNDQNVIFFRNQQNKRLNVLYKRNDGNIGWIDSKSVKN
ncbi:MAG: ribosomal subunit interface protein [Rickettsiales bacterium]|nr:ribosomal subunit interface protein [Rickettsiales bacterium]|tara:strand:+ start:925 stop:1500 length:576 start_codon:yes stop_codon:yes gene_type:complete